MVSSVSERINYCFGVYEFCPLFAEFKESNEINVFGAFIKLLYDFTHILPCLKTVLTSVFYTLLENKSKVKYEKNNFTRIKFRKEFS